MSDPRHCPKCNAPRGSGRCFKCGTETFLPHPNWSYPALPDVAKIRDLAREVGYAIGEHGTQQRDLDLIAAPWTEEAVGNWQLMEHIAHGMNGRILEVERKPLGRYACSIQIDGYFKVIDLSVCPQIRATPGARET